MSHQESIVISQNVPVDEGLLRALNAGGEMHSDRYATIIDPKYHEEFMLGVLIVMRGIIDRNTYPIDLGEQEVLGPVFDFSRLHRRYEGRDVTMIAPYIGQQFVGLYPDPMESLRGFHEQLIAETNYALAKTRSPLRLAPIPLDAA